MTDSAEQLFRKSGALLQGHFLLTSGLHSPVYWEKFRVLQFPEYTEKLCAMIARRFSNNKIEVVAGPTTGGVILAYEVARQLSVRSIFAEKENNERAFRRGFTIGKGERVLLVDDILTTGGSVCEMIGAIAKFGGNIIGIGVLVNRSEQEPDFGFPLFACVRSPAITYQPSCCPLCAAGVPLSQTGEQPATNSIS